MYVTIFWIALYFLVVSVFGFLQALEEVSYYDRLGRAQLAQGEEWTFAKECVVALRSLKFDFLGLHCPWSWKRAVSYRTQVARYELARRHKSNCETAKAALQSSDETLAKEYFGNRFWVWTVFLLSPFKLLLMLGAALLLTLLEGYITIRDKYRSRKNAMLVL
jgi:hypothetical protein